MFHSRSVHLKIVPRAALDTNAYIADPYSSYYLYLVCPRHQLLYNSTDLQDNYQRV